MIFYWCIQMESRHYLHALRVPVRRPHRRVVMVLPYAPDAAARGACLASRLRHGLVTVGLTDVTEAQAAALLEDHLADYATSDVSYTRTDRGTVNLTGRGWGHYNYPASDVLFF